MLQVSKLSTSLLSLRSPLGPSTRQVLVQEAEHYSLQDYVEARYWPIDPVNIPSLKQQYEKVENIPLRRSVSAVRQSDPEVC